MSAQNEFNATIYVSEQLNRQLVNMSQDLAVRAIKCCAEQYHFDAEEACRLLNLAMLKLERNAPIKEKGAKTPKTSSPKPRFPLPYNGEFVQTCCFALRQNNGLYTQCTGTRKGDDSFCKGCATGMQKAGVESPEYGTIQMRNAVGIFEYVDPKGRKPTAYAKVMKKYKIDQAQVLEEAGKFHINIHADHFTIPEESKRGRPKTDKEPKAKGVKGRPKKSKKVLQIEGDDEDLFSALVAKAGIDASDNDDNDGSDEASVEGSDEGTVGTVELEKTISNTKSDNDKENERIAKAAEKAEKEAKRKAEKEAKLAAEKAEKEAKKEAERLAREAKKAADEAAKAAKKAADEAAKAAKKEAAEKAKAEKEASKKASKKAPEPAVSDEPDDDEPDVVKKIEYEGQKYLKSKKTGIVYDYAEYIKTDEQVVIGKWNDKTNKIDFTPTEEEEVESEYYDSD